MIKAKKIIESVEIKVMTDGVNQYAMVFNDDFERIVHDLCSEIEALKKANESEFKNGYEQAILRYGYKPLRPIN